MYIYNRISSQKLLIHHYIGLTKSTLTTSKSTNLFYKHLNASYSLNGSKGGKVGYFKHIPSKEGRNIGILVGAKNMFFHSFDIRNLKS